MKKKIINTTKHRLTIYPDVALVEKSRKVLSVINQGKKVRKLFISDIVIMSLRQFVEQYKDYLQE